MVDIAREVEETIDYKFKSPLETLSKGALHLRMLYNQVSSSPTTLVLILTTSIVYHPRYSASIRMSFARLAGI